jgi:GTPase
VSNDNPVNTKLPSYEVHHAGAERALKEIAGMLKDRMPPGYGFSLFVFEFGDDGAVFYVSSAQRKDMLNVLKEFIKKQESAA